MLSLASFMHRYWFHLKRRKIWVSWAFCIQICCLKDSRESWIVANHRYSKISVKRVNLLALKFKCNSINYQPSETSNIEGIPIKRREEHVSLSVFKPKWNKMSYFTHEYCWSHVYESWILFKFSESRDVCKLCCQWQRATWACKVHNMYYRCNITMKTESQTTDRMESGWAEQCLHYDGQLHQKQIFIIRSKRCNKSQSAIQRA